MLKSCKENVATFIGNVNVKVNRLQGCGSVLERKAQAVKENYGYE